MPDTNVLLNLYRYSSEGRDSLLAVLANLGDRLWVPHQVKAEFWAARDGVLRDPRGTLALTADLDKLRVRAAQLLQEWARGRSISVHDAAELRADMDAGFDAVAERVAAFDDADGAQYLEDSSNDPVVRGLAGVLAGRVGAPPAQDVLAKRVARGHERIREDIPPGYRDKGKPGDAPVGDYLIWCEILDEAGRRDCDALFVTGDVKEDWWRRVREAPHGPRPELVREMALATGRFLFMVQPDGLLERARGLLGVTISAASLENVENVQRTQQVSGEWAAEAVAAVLDRLLEEAPVQAAVVRRAAELGGFISRDEVYQIGGYDQRRSLRGFTRPVRRIVAAFQDRGLIPVGIDDLLETSYDDETVGLATGFTVPRAVLPLVLEWVGVGDPPD
ncbi:PIN-like domain-containing protein [Frankia sp. AiPa1]|uniref:PIN-like domain-containing protein n=1 Tax=Frankia sp. AiPa1 TaxID=573492 RepID=UPI00202B4804|nr:PIN-like domain-containing protein [Frankia sp. AiPa1]MCL9761636.1 PIN-like domain-containing protein [Frankia sp. AiPa1]